MKKFYKSIFIVLVYSIFGISSADTSDDSPFGVVNETTSTGATNTDTNATNNKCIEDLNYFIGSDESETSFCDNLNKHAEVKNGILFDDTYHRIDADACRVLAYATRNGRSGKYTKEVKRNLARKCHWVNNVQYTQRIDGWFGYDSCRVYIGGILEGYEAVVKGGTCHDGTYKVCLRRTGSYNGTRAFTGLSVSVPEYYEGSEEESWYDRLWKAKTGDATRKVAREILEEKIKSSDVLCD